MREVPTRSFVSWCGAMMVLAAVLIPAVGRAQTLEERRGLIAEPRLLATGISWIEDFGRDERNEPSDGFYPELGHMITGAGWISVGPGYRRHVFADRALFDVSGAVSWRAYKIAQARLEFSRLAANRLTLGGQVFWQDFTQVRYFGIGPSTVETAVSDYRMQAIDGVAYARLRPYRALVIGGSVGVLSRISLSSSTGPFDRDHPDTLHMFPDDPAAGLSRQPRFLHGDISVASDTRDHRGYPTRGGLYRAAWATYRDRGDGTLTFNRVEAEGAQFVPIARNHGVLAVRAWGVLSDTPSGSAVPFYFVPSLGGGNTLRGYPDYRFHDRHLIVVNVESRWALFDHVDAALFFDAGNVAARAADLNFDRTSYGIGFRLHTSQTTLGRVDVGRSREGWRIVFKATDPLRIGRLSRRTAVLPFVP